MDAGTVSCSIVCVGAAGGCCLELLSVVSLVLSLSASDLLLSACRDPASLAFSSSTMSARGVKTKATDNDGSDFAYRQSIEDRYQSMAALKAQIRLSSSAARPYFLLATLLTLLHLVLHSQHSPLLRFHPLLFPGLSPLPLLSLLIVTAVVVTQSLQAIQHSARSWMLWLSAALLSLLAVVTLLLPLSTKRADGLTTVDWLVLGMHAVGLSIAAWGLYNGFRLHKISKTKRL